MIIVFQPTSISSLVVRELKFNDNCIVLSANQLCDFVNSFSLRLVSIACYIY